MIPGRYPDPEFRRFRAFVYTLAGVIALTLAWTGVRDFHAAWCEPLPETQIARAAK